MPDGRGQEIFNVRPPYISFVEPAPSDTTPFPLTAVVELGIVTTTFFLPATVPPRTQFHLETHATRSGYTS